MKERLVRGTNVANVVRVLRSHKERPLPELGPWEQDLVRKRVSSSTWYALKVFDSLLQVVHRYVYDGSEHAAQNMGRSFAREMIEGDPSQFVVPGNVLASLGSMTARWRDHFNFGEVAVTALPDAEGQHGARVRLTGYPDMSACHGQTFVGFMIELAARAGARDISARIEERPWMHNNVLSFTVHWS